MKNVNTPPNFGIFIKFQATDEFLPKCNSFFPWFGASEFNFSAEQQNFSGGKYDQEWPSLLNTRWEIRARSGGGGAEYDGALLFSLLGLIFF